MIGPDAAPERDTIAELEVYGLSPVVIDNLEEGLGVIYVDELREVNLSDVLSCNRMGVKRVEELRSALRRYLSKSPVRSPEQCVSFSNG
jgi:hypothetical protein